MAAFPKLKKNISAFLTSEEGKIDSQSAIKIAFALLAIGAMLDMEVQAGSHTNYLHQSGSWGKHVSNIATHSNVHTSHSSHGSHASW